MTKKINRCKKLIRVLKRKWFKPAICTLAMSFLIYIGVSSIVIQKKTLDKNVPHFLISRISDTYDETEFSHLLLTIQEIIIVPNVSNQLKEFANAPYPAYCPKMLERYLNRMNWQPQAFLIRVKKMFRMYEAYDRVQRLDDTISFLEGEIKAKKLPYDINNQVDLLKQERDDLLNKELPENEYRFIQEYGGIIQQLMNEE